MSNLVERLYNRAAFVGGVGIAHDAAQEIESLRQQLKEALAVRENCTLVPTAELKKMQKQLAEKEI